MTWCWARTQPRALRAGGCAGAVHTGDGATLMGQCRRGVRRRGCSRRRGCGDGRGWRRRRWPVCVTWCWARTQPRALRAGGCAGAVHTGDGATLMGQCRWWRRVAAVCADGVVHLVLGPDATACTSCRGLRRSRAHYADGCVCVSGRWFQQATEGSSQKKFWWPQSPVYPGTAYDRSSRAIFSLRSQSPLY